MVHRPSTTHAPRIRTAAWLALFAVAALVTLPAFHFVPKGAPAIAAAAGAPTPQSLSAPEAIRSHLSCPVCLALAQARSAAIHANAAAHVVAGLAPALTCAAAKLAPPTPDHDEQRPRAPPVPA